MTSVTRQPTFEHCSLEKPCLAHTDEARICNETVDAKDLSEENTGHLGDPACATLSGITGPGKVTRKGWSLLLDNQERLSRGERLF